MTRLLSVRTAVALVAVVSVAACASDSNDATTPTTTVAGPTTTATSTPTTSSVPTTTAPRPTTTLPRDGVSTLSGSLPEEAAILASVTSESVVLLEDLTAAVTDDHEFVVPPESQTVGRIEASTSSRTAHYVLPLPAAPPGQLHDFGAEPTGLGVAVYAVSLVSNVWGDSYIDERDWFGHTFFRFSSVELQPAPFGVTSVVGGKIVVFAPSADRPFPIEAGADEVVFTDDDVIGRIPRGWTVLDLDVQPFQQIRVADVTVDVAPPESFSFADLSTTDSYEEAFDQLVALLRTDYTFTEQKQIDWDALAAPVRPQILAADRSSDESLFAATLRDFVQGIPDIHTKAVGFEIDDLVRDEFAGSIGLELVETDAGEAVVARLAPFGSAAGAGVEIGAVVTTIGGRPVAEVIAATVPPTGPFSLASMERLDQARFATRFAPDQEPVELTFVNPGQAPRTMALEVTPDELQSELFDDTGAGDLPVEYSILPSGYGYIRVNGFLDDFGLTVALWQRALDALDSSFVFGYVLDLRSNGRGAIWLAEQMAADLFETRQTVATFEHYDARAGAFLPDPTSIDLIVEDGGPRLEGPVVILVGSGCVSACELFADVLHQLPDSTTVGHTGTQGGGGEIRAVLMPDELLITYSGGRLVSPAGSIIIEGVGVVPDVVVPVTQDSVIREAAGEDVLLAAAELALDDALFG